MFSLFVVALLASLSTAQQLNTTNPTNTNHRMSWRGNIPGHGNVILIGSAQDVEAQIFSMAPALRAAYALNNPFMSPTPHEYNESEVVVINGSYSSKLPARPSLAGRDDIDGGIDLNSGEYSETYWDCGDYATGSYYEAYAAIAGVNAPGGVTGGEWQIDEAVGNGLLVPTCERLACSVGTAVYWCNYNYHAISSSSATIAAVAAMVADGSNEFNWMGCCMASQNRGAHNQYSGAVHIGNGTTVIVGWGNCTNDDYFIDPNTYSVPGAYGDCI